MIKLERNFTPLFFSPQNVSRLTERFKNNGSHVWHHDDVKNSLMEISDKKCAYCEVKLGEKSTYHEVEHFKDKNDYPDDVIEWNNLLPSCRHCNSSKGTHDVVHEPIINPFNDIPAEYFYIKNFRVKGKNGIGTLTIDVLNLNDREHLVKPRCETGTIISEKLEDSVVLFEEYISNPTNQKKRKLIGTVRGILNECQKSAIFSAVSATILHTSEDYLIIRDIMKANNLWDEDMEQLHLMSRSIKLPTKA
ncbi:Uncharacterised protein [Yersinia intermedia]|uniref:HNH endonuclease n=1 Tax=Yersinia intermedia TaxID=631 RepID=UPI0001A531C7|nr:HNH endonuclease [Yersinia intermedia]EEQ18398.1 hypothetical protein yinte0001_7030 [Yersinia intermedia ATCC 29909]VDZ51967.1 Uncharacterised protein [Yersinia intermedia]